MGDVIGNRKLGIIVAPTLDLIASEMADNCSIEEIVEFIGLLDYKLEDVEFVEQVYAWAVKQMKEEGLLGGEL